MEFCLFVSLCPFSPLIPDRSRTPVSNQHRSIVQPFPGDRNHSLNTLFRWQMTQQIPLTSFFPKPENCSGTGGTIIYKPIRFGDASSDVYVSQFIRRLLICLQYFVFRCTVSRVEVGEDGRRDGGAGWGGGVGGRVDKEGVSRIVL